MKKLKFLILPLTAAAVLLSACGGEPVNQGPELRGVSDITCLVNTYVDLLDGVAALDAEDGDITPRLQITVTPETAVDNGYAVFDKAGDYEICYEVRDSLGKLARTTAFASVIGREVYKSDVCTNGFSVTAGGGAKILAEGLNGNAYAFKAEGGEIAEDIRLSRSYSLACGTEYTFRYHLTSNSSGRIKAAADGKAIADLRLEQGENVLEFRHRLPLRHDADGGIAFDTVNIGLWFGGAVDSDAGGGLEISLDKAELSYVMDDGGLTERLPDFSFNGRTHDRFDSGNGNIVGSAEAVDGGNGVRLNITETASPEIWRGGVFVDTGLPLTAGETYYISFDLQSERNNPYEVVIQNKQWDEHKFKIVRGVNGSVNEQFTVDGGNAGSLWLYIQSGNMVNSITLSNLSVKTESGGEKTEIYSIGGFKANHSNGGAGKARTEYGKLYYDIEGFGADWGNNELQSPEFALLGAADNYVIEFKAKASKPLSFVFLIHDERASAWTTIVWRQMRLEEGEAVYSVNCDNVSIDSVYRIFWQFGSQSNSGYRNAAVEISEIKICLKNELEI